MPLLPRRFERLQKVLNRRMSNLTILLENVEKPHNLSAILRTCDAVGVLEAHAVSKTNNTPTFNSTAQGSQKWVKLQSHKKMNEAVSYLKGNGFKLYGTNLGINAIDYRKCDFTGPTAFILGAEKWGLSEEATNMMDKAIFIPMQGMVQSLNVSVATSILLFEAIRQRKVEGLLPEDGEGLDANLYKKTIFEWAYPQVANWCIKQGRKYPELNSKGEITEVLPRTIKLRY